MVYLLFAMVLWGTPSKNQCTPPKFNMEPENGWFPKGISFSRDFFSGSMLNFSGVTQVLFFSPYTGTPSFKESSIEYPSSNCPLDPALGGIHVESVVFGYV